MSVSCVSSSIEAAVFFIQSKEVRIHFRPLFNVCKSHSSGSQVREKRKVKTEPGSNLKFGALSCERREKPREEDYGVWHLPVVTLRLQSQATPYLHQEANNFWAIVQCCHQYPWLGRNLLSCFLCGTVILFCHVQRWTCSVPRNLESLLHETSWHEVGEVWLGPGTSRYPSAQQSSLSWGISKKIKAILD